MQRAARVAHEWKEIFIVTSKRMKPAQELKRLPGQRNQVLNARLHALRRNPPLRALEIELLPARLAELARAYKEEEGEFQGDADHLAPSVVINRIEQFSKAPRIADPWAMARYRRLKEPAEAQRDVSLDVPVSHRVAEHAAAAP